MELLQTYCGVLAEASDAEKRQFLQPILDDVYIKDKQVIAIRSKPDYYDLLSTSPAVPTRFELAISALTGPHVWPLHHGTSACAA